MPVSTEIRNEHDAKNFALHLPGNSVGLDLGISDPLSGRTALLLQLNTQWKHQDSGDNADPDDTGGTFVHVSPGVGIELGEKTRLYGFVQLPVYQDFNGVQLTADCSLAAGISRRSVRAPTPALSRRKTARDVLH